jgi:hypothetical protein
MNQLHKESVVDMYVDHVQQTEEKLRRDNEN